ncbi:hypothetical protein [Curtobacterium sp. 9128]|uniref:DUF6984 family protein n=1 Tax=Curtobacterium sp. 9128 TaxID=1793722 RepID=UPI002481B5BC|nr:hypothetical protein [Curtobacterium sp. 9128]
MHVLDAERGFCAGSLVRRLLAHHTPRSAQRDDIDLSTVLVTRYDESECLRFMRPASSDAGGFNSDMYTFDDHDGVQIIAFLTFDPEGNIQELDLWKADDTPILGLGLGLAGSSSSATFSRSCLAR